MPLGPFDFKGFSVAEPINRLKSGVCSVAVNCRAYFKGGVTFRNLLSDPILVAGTPETLLPVITPDDPQGEWTNLANFTSNSSYASATITPYPFIVVGPRAFTGVQSIPSNAIVTSIKISWNAYASVSSGVTMQPLIIVGVQGYNLPIISITGTPAAYSAVWTNPVSNAVALINSGTLATLLNWEYTGLGTETVYINNYVITVYYSVPGAGSVPNTLARLNDSTPNGPASGYILTIGTTAGIIYANTTSVATGLSGNPVSLVPFRPNTSVQPWCYVGDSAPQGNVTLSTKYLSTGAVTSFVTNGMAKVRSDSLTFKSGIKEPQLAPVVSTTDTGLTTTGTLLATAIPWTNYSSANSSFGYGETEGFPNVIPPVDGTIWYNVNCKNASTITINSLVPSGTVVINGANITTQAQLVATSSGRVGSGAPGYPGQFLQTLGAPTHPSVASYVVGAFIDASGNVITTTEYGWVAPLYIPIVVDVGVSIGTPITVPNNAVSFQIGINSVGNTFTQGTPPNSGSITISTTVTTSALPIVTAIMGSLTAYYWGDSPSNADGAYIWKNPDDSGGSGPTRSTSDAVGSTTGNSFIFDATFNYQGTPPPPDTGPGIPGLPGIGNGNVQMQWTTLSPESVAIGSNAVYAAPITNYYPNPTPPFGNFNFCLTGNIYFPSGGPGVYYTLVLTNHDSVIWGIGGGVTLVPGSVVTSGVDEGTAAISQYGQTITVVGGYPLLPRQNTTHGDDNSYAKTTLQVNPPAAGIYPIEIDYDYWYRAGRILLLMASPTAGGTPTIIPPLPSNIRQQVQYRYTYRSTATGATSNPSPESTAESVPVTANTVTSLWSNDPQVDVVDYYRLDSTTTSFTYVATGPNDNDGNPFTTPGTNTPISDSLLDTELGNQLLNYDNFEPFPSIDLPQKGICDVSGGVITWVSGGAIGGTATGFNPRWLAGTTILIGSPTSLAYVFIARPTPAGFQNSYTYPLNFIILDTAGHYQLVTVSGISQATGTPSFNDSGGTTTSGGATFTDKGFFMPTGFVTQVTIPGVPDGSNLAYQIPEPTLANQPLPYLWGPTDNVNFAYGVGDPLRPGTLYWSAGSNLDAAPDTNQIEVTDPGEPLVNGAISGGLGVLFSIKRAWLILPNFFNALATVTGVEGSTWSLQESGITRGLYMPRCVCVEGGGNIFFRVNDGIHISPRGGSSISITDQDLYPLFSHENADSGASVPQPVTRNGVTIYPPDDSQPQMQKFSIQGPYLYYDYIGLGDGYPHTLVFDINARGWVWDLYNPAATIHASNDGQSVQGVLVGCQDGTIRQLASAGTETITGVVATPAFGGRGYVHVGQMVCEYSSTSTVTLSFYVADEGNNSYAPQTFTLPSTSGQLTKYFFRPSAAKWKLLVAQFSSSVPFVMNFAGAIAYIRPWGSSAEYTPVPIFSGAGGEG